MPLPAKGPGRPKGASNKITRDVKEAVLEAFHEVGGKNYLVTLAADDPKAFVGLVAKLIPAQLQHSGSIDTRPANAMRDDELAAIASSGSAGVAEAPGNKARLN